MAINNTETFALNSFKYKSNTDLTGNVSGLKLTGKNQLADGEIHNDIFKAGQISSPDREMCHIDRLRKQANASNCRDTMKDLNNYLNEEYGIQTLNTGQITQNKVTPSNGKTLKNISMAPKQEDIELISGSMTFGSGEQTYHFDLGKLFRALQNTASRDSSPGRQKKPATDAQVEEIRQSIESGKNESLPNLKKWLRFQYGEVSPEAFADRAASVIDEYLGHPENLTEFAPALGINMTFKARAAGFAVKTLRKFGIDIHLPGGDHNSVKQFREEALQIANDMEDVFPMICGGLKTSLSMYETHTGEPGMNILRDLALSFADPKRYAGQRGLTLTDEQTKILEQPLKKDAEKIIDALEDFYKIRSERGCDESFSAFGHALLTDMLNGIKTGNKKSN